MAVRRQNGPTAVQTVARNTVSFGMYGIIALELSMLSA